MRHLPLAQELEELDPFAQAAAHHLGAAHHLTDDRGDPILDQSVTERHVRVDETKRDIVVNRFGAVPNFSLTA